MDGFILRCEWIFDLKNIRNELISKSKLFQTVARIDHNNLCAVICFQLLKQNLLKKNEFLPILKKPQNENVFGNKNFMEKIQI